KDVYIAELLLCLVKEAIDLIRGGHASLHSDGLSAGHFDSFHDAVCASPIRVVVHCNGGALIRQRQGDARPDSFRCSCYQCDLSIELSHLSISSLRRPSFRRGRLFMTDHIRHVSVGYASAACSLATVVSNL